MAIVIVTKKCYLLCEKVNHITLQEESENYNDHSYIPYWNIVIDVEALPASSGGVANSRREEKCVSIKVGDHEAAYALFQNIVNQIREQLPDQLFLNQLAERFLTGGALNEQSIDTRYEEIRRIRKTKTKRKKVLRRAKKRN